MPRPAPHLTNRRFGRLTVGLLAEPDSRNKARWHVVCDCGIAAIKSQNNLISGATKSCGCLQNDTVKTVNKTHGVTGSVEYHSWQRMKARCLNPNSTQYKWYGLRGVTVCERWMDSFETFLADMGHKPSPAHSLDRVDTNKGYEPENCRWATSKEQQRNKRNNRRVTIGDTTQSLADWVDQTGSKYDTVLRRMQRGVDPREAMSTR
jgi:hypothetical protein